MGEHVNNETTARPGDLILVIGGWGALDGLAKIRESYRLRVSEVTELEHIPGWTQIEGLVEESGRRFRNLDRMILVRPAHYMILEES